MEDLCTGGSNDMLCKKGYTGALCESCDIHGDVWGKSYGNIGK